MKRVTGIGGIFFKAKDAPALCAWYKNHLGIDVKPWGGAAFDWVDADGKPTGGTTAWSIAKEESDQFAPSTASFMVNYRVEDLHALVAALKSGKLGGAAIDVFTQEPLPASEIFTGCPNLILTPHIAGVTFEANVRVSWMIADAVIKALA